MIAQIFLLLVLFQLKHFLCDYPFQTAYMLEKGRYTGWVGPLALHALVHYLGTCAVVFTWAALSGDCPWWAGLAVLDFVVHFTVDRIKAAPNLGGRWNPRERFFWWALGADQAAHHLTHYFIIFCLVRGRA